MFDFGKVLRKGKNTKHVWFHYEKYERTLNIIKIS